MTEVVTAPAHRLSRRVALVVAAAFFIEQMDGTILVTAAAAIADDFRVAPSDVGLAMTAYFVAVSAFIPVSGWLTDRFGPRRVFLTAVVGFVAASVFCATSTSMPMLVAGRTAQGIAGAMMVPVGRFIVLGATDKADLVRAVAYLTWPALAAPLVAPLIGGLLTQYASWQWIFLVNVPLGAAVMLAAWFIIPNAPPEGRRSLDPVTLLFVVSGVGLLVVGLDLIADVRWTATALPLLLVAAAALAAAVRRAWRVPTPLLDLRSFAIETFRVSHTGGVAYRIVVGAAPFLLTLLMQDGLGWSPVTAGLMLMWVFAGNLGVKPLTTPLLRAVGFRWMIVGASVGIAATFLVCAWVTPQTPGSLVAATLLVSGACRSIGFTGYNTLQYADVPPDRMNGATTVSSALVQLATGIGVALVALGVRVGDVVAASVGVAATDLAGYRATFVAMALIVVLSTAAVLRLPAGAADHVRRPAGRTAG